MGPGQPDLKIGNQKVKKFISPSPAVFTLLLLLGEEKKSLLIKY
jgi:hypothetical protein